MAFSHSLFARAILTSGLLTFGAQSCGVSPVDCPQVQADQRSGRFTPMTVIPTELRIDRTLSAQQQADIELAAQEWNQWSQVEMGRAIFVTRVSDVPPEVRLASPRDYDRNGGDRSWLYVVGESDSRRFGSLERPKDRRVTMAGTFREIRGRTVHQVVLLRNQEIPRAQFRSHVLHELGHVLGLAHSCRLDGEKETRGLIACESLTQDHPYRKAVMYPGLFPYDAQSGGPEIKETLTDNDRARASCLLRERASALGENS